MTEISRITPLNCAQPVEQPKPKQKLTPFARDSVAKAEEPYDLDCTVAVAKPPEGTKAPPSNSCTCNNTCMNCGHTDTCIPHTTGC